MISGKLSNGFEFEIDENNLDDMRFIEALSDLNKGNPLAMPTVYDCIFGKEQKEKLYDEVAKANNGRVPIKVMTDLFEEVMTQSKDVKN